MCMNVYLCINEWIYLIAYVGAGSWSFRGVQAIVLGSEKLAPHDLNQAIVLGSGKLAPYDLTVDAPILPRGCSGFIITQYQCLEIWCRMEGSKAPTPDIHTTISSKCMGTPVNI